MADTLYAKARESFLKGEIAWQTDAFKLVLIDSGAYTPDFDNDQFLSDIPSGARIATSSSFGSKTTAGGYADAADPVFSALTGTSIEAFVVYKDTGSAATSNLIAWYDEAAGLPFTPSGADLIVQINALGLFRL